MSCKRKLTGHQVAETGYFNSLNGIISRIDYQTGNKSQTLLWGKVGNYYSLARAGELFVSGNHEKGNQALMSFGAGWTAGELTAMGVARFALVGAAGTASWPAILAGIVVGSAVSIAIDYYFSNKDCDPDPTEPYRPRPTESPTQGYIKKYYDPIILDLDGNNGVGTVSKFGVLFMMNGGAMFDHDGVATATERMAVNDEWWEMVV